jgi:hypothetical protein
VLRLYLLLVLTLFFPYFGSIVLSQSLATQNPDIDPIFGLGENAKDHDLIEFHFGLTGGTSYYLANTEEIIELIKNQQLRYELSIQESSLGLHFGVHSQLRIGSLFIRPDIVFNSNSFSYQLKDVFNNSAVTLVEERYQYLVVPLLIGYDISPFFVMGGPVGQVFLANQSGFKENFMELTTDLKRWRWAYQLGVGLNFFNIGLDIRYEGSLNSLGTGISYNGQNFYFSKTPSRLIATLTFNIY